MPRHIYIVNTVPSSAPSGVGHHYIDISSKRSYISVGTASHLDWLTANGQPFKETVVLDATDVANNYIDLPYPVLPDSITLFFDEVHKTESFAYVVDIQETYTRISFIGELESPLGDCSIYDGASVTIHSMKL